MMTCLLKRILPFTLTFALGAAAAGIVGLFTGDGAGVFKRRQQTYYGGGGGGCSKGYRHKLLAESKPLYIKYQPSAVYTSEARRRDFAGTVRLRVTFGADGAVKAVETLQGQPYGLTQSAERAAWGITFLPSLENGLPVPVTRTIEYDFPSELTRDEF
jgi:TonB family protein